MRAGLLKEIIEIYRKGIVQDEYGSTSEQYLPIRKTKARVVHKGGNRELINNEIVYPYLKTFEVWNYIDVQEKIDEIHWNNKKYRVLSVESVKEQNKKIIETEEVNE